MVDPYKDKRRPRFPEIVAKALEEEKRHEKEGLWKVLARESDFVWEKTKEKEKELEEELENTFGKKTRIERNLEDLV